MKPLAVSMGDPAGIGLELAARVWAERDADTPPFFFVGDADALERASARLGLVKPKLNVITSADRLTVAPDQLTVRSVPLAMKETPGAPDPVNADATLAAIEMSVSAVRSGAASALVTMPTAMQTSSTGCSPAMVTG